MPTVGWLGGIVGNRNLFLTDISISLVGASLAEMARSLEALIGLMSYGAGKLSDRFGPKLLIIIGSVNSAHGEDDDWQSAKCAFEIPIG